MSSKKKQQQHKDTTAATSTPAAETKAQPKENGSKVQRDNEAPAQKENGSSGHADISFLPVFVQRVTPNMFSSLFSTAMGYYETSKVKFPKIAEAENNLIKLSSPVIEKVKPAINGLDQFGCKQLDKIETQVSNSKKKIEESIYKPAEQAIDSTRTFVYNNIVNTKPINQALVITEYAVDNILPSSNKKTAEEPVPSDTLDVNARFTRLRSKTMDKLKSLQPYSEEKLKSLTHSVSLIEYASKYIDVNHTVEEVKEFTHAPIQKSSQYVKTSVNYVLSSKVTQSVESIAIDGYHRATKIAETVYDSTPVQKGRHIVQDGFNYVRSSKVSQSVESVAKDGIHKAVTVGQSAISYIPKPVLDKVENTYTVIIDNVPYAQKTVSTLQYYLSPLINNNSGPSPSDE